MEKDKKERRLRLYIMLFTILFFWSACSLTAQITRVQKYSDRPDIISLYPDYPLYFLYKKDTIFLSVVMDSLSPNYRPCYLYAFYPKKVKDFDIVIGFEDNPAQVFKPDIIDSSDKKNNYVEYKIYGQYSTLLIGYNYKYLSFNGDQQFPIMDDRSLYFRKFYQDVYLNKK